MRLLRRSLHSLLAMTQGILCLLAMTDEFRIYCDEILGSSPRMTKKVKSGDDKKRKAEIFIEIASAFSKPRNDGISAMTEF